MSADRLALWPSIDLREGRVVRLLRGELARTTVYDSDPVEVARRFADEGADGIHIVDLDAAFGRGENRSVIFGIVRSAGIPVQVGGGLRSGEEIRIFLERGVRRAVVGTFAFRDPQEFLFLLEEIGPSPVVVALDCKDGRPTVHGWTEDAGAGGAAVVASQLWSSGVRTLLVTDVARDGAMEGPNLALLAAVRAAFPGEVLASGGMRGEEDLAPVDTALAGGARGAIFGRALHGGTTTVARLAAALAGEGRTR